MYLKSFLVNVDSYLINPLPFTEIMLRPLLEGVY